MYDLASNLTIVLMLSVLCAGATVAVVYVWHLSELFSQIRSKLEAKEPAWWITLLLCPYCVGTWIVAFFWLSLALTDQVPGNRPIPTIGFLFCTGLFYMAWSAFYHLWRLF